MKIKQVLFISLLLVAVQFAQSLTQQKLNSLFNNPGNKKFIQNAQFSITAIDVESNKTVAEINPLSSLAPASSLKLLTTAAAIHFLGPDFKFRTEIYYSGKIEKNGILKGDLIIKSGYDPTFGSDLIKGNPGFSKISDSIYLFVKKAGIKKINGSVIVDPGEYNTKAKPDLWYWEDLGNYYGASFNGFAVNDNLYELYLSSPQKEGSVPDIIKTIPVVKKLTFKNNLKLSSPTSGDNAFIYCAPYQYNAEIFGTIPSGKGEFKIKGSIPDPAGFFAEYLTDYFIQNKISVLKKPAVASVIPDYSSSRMLMFIESPDLASIIKMTNIKSFNLYAESLLRYLAVRINNSPGTDSGVEVIRKFLQEISVSDEGLNMYDGCGLSRSNSVTTSMMAGMLAGIAKKDYFNKFYSSMAVAADGNPETSFGKFGEGTVIANNARLKSGYIRGVRSFTGYLINKNNKLLAFSVIVNNYSCPTKEITNLIKEALVILAVN